MAAELGDVADALRAADLVDPTRMPDGLASRRAQMHLDLAWSQVQRKHDAEATLHLLEAERVAPEVLRHNVMAQELMRSMLARGSKSKTRTLVEIARRSGLMH